MSSPASASERAGRRSTAFDLLHPDVQRWIWQHRWTELRDAQERAVEPVLAGRDVLIAAATASGKTEAAFLPVCSALASDPEPVPGVRAVYLSPLKALINDQYGRLDELCEHLDIRVHRWHGDVPGSGKARVLAAPSGLLLITPESLEAMFVLRGPRIARLFEGLRYVVVDEMHSFIGTERGAQTQSLLHRLELALRRRVPRIGLSATLGDMAGAAGWLRPGRAERVTVIVAADDSTEVRLQIRGYLDATPATAARLAGQVDHANQAGQAGGESEEDSGHGATSAVADHLFATLRGTDNLVFANSRGNVERYADLLARRAERARVPNEFVPHHGSLSKDLREHVEARLKDRTTPVTAICTSTLEMGIDIGTVTSVAQLGAPPSVSSLRQRLGRSGRRGEPAILRAYLTEPEVTDRTGLVDRLRADLVQTIAMVELLGDHWYEPPTAGGLHLSTLIQQLLSLIAQHGGATPAQAHAALCGTGPFAAVDPATFAALLRSLGSRDIIAQGSDGLLLPGPTGERIVNHYSFYAAFRTAEEYRLVAAGRSLGTLPIDHPIGSGSLLIFAGRRWKVLDVDTRARVVELVRSSGGRPPGFGGHTGQVADEVRRRMLGIYTDDWRPTYLDATAGHLLAEGRRNFARHRLAETPLVPDGNHTHLVAWRGDRILATLAVALTARGLEVGQDAMALTVTADPPTLVRHLRDLAAQPTPDPLTLAGQVTNQVIDKWDELLDRPLLDAACAARDLDVPSAWDHLRAAVTRLPPGPW
ncbi:MAG TPA: DEAD/DEAH box helicase [Mycobacteriales bacterium]|nr:DEAD/DEAH box helicase [Mycobacteriales bacterium]